MVNITPAARDSPAEPVVWTMLFFEDCGARRRRWRILIERTEIGIEADTVRPARRPT